MAMVSKNPEYIGKYKVLSELGQGAMGHVYKGFDEGIEREVAIKVIYESKRHGVMGSELDKRFKQEAQAAARCNHPNIVTIFEYGFTEQDRSPFIVMEYIEGIELKHYLNSKAGELTVGQSVSILTQVLEALSYAHRSGVVHRDIKPTNIILRSDQKVKVMDFGVARLDSSDLTVTGHMIGTPSYMSPEGLKGEPVDARSDLYTTGQLLLELLTKNKLKVGEEPDRRVGQILSNKFPQPLIFSAFARLLRKALAIEPDARYQTADQFLSDLVALKSSLPIDFTSDQAAFSDLTTSIVMSQHASTRGDQASSRSRGALSSTASKAEGTLMANTLSAELLVAIENKLTTHIGPVAPLILKRTLGRSSSISELTKKLGRHIDDESDRTDFIKAITHSTQQASKTQSGLEPTRGDGTLSEPLSSSSKVSMPFLTDELLNRYSKKLALSLGPIAPQLVKKMAKRCRSEEELKVKLSLKIENLKERAQFLES